MKQLRIAMFNLNESTQDPRVRRVAGTLAGQGHQVTVFGPSNAKRLSQELVDNFTVRRISRPIAPSVNPLLGICQAFPQTYRLLEECDPEVMHFDAENRLSVPGIGFGVRVYCKLLRTFPRLRDLLGAKSAMTGPRFHEILTLREMLTLNLNLAQEAIPSKPHVVHCNDLNTLLAGVMIKELTGARLVYDAHEIFPEQGDDTAYSQTWKAFHTRLEHSLLPYTDLRLTVCDSLAEYFQRRYGCGPFVAVRNVPSRHLLAPAHVLDRHNRPRKILYHGYYFQHRGLEQVIQASALVPNALFVFRGLGAQEKVLRRMVSQMGLQQRVLFVPPVQVHELISYAADCDIGLNPFIPVCLNTEYALPNKFFEYLSAGLAVASSDLIEMRRLTDRHGLGVTFDSKDPAQIAASLQSLLDDDAALEACRRNAFAAAQSEYYWEKEEGKLIDHYDHGVKAAA